MRICFFFCDVIAFISPPLNLFPVFFLVLQEQLVILQIVTQLSIDIGVRFTTASGIVGADNLTNILNSLFLALSIFWSYAGSLEVIVFWDQINSYLFHFSKQDLWLHALSS